jgi:hypothetical protein
LRVTWNDLPRIFAAIEPDKADDTGGSSGSGVATPEAASGAPDAFPIVLRLIEEHVAAAPAEHMAIALWILHCWVFDRFS